MKSEDIHLILSLRLLIARTANPDSLAWWDDESLTPHAHFVLGRIFPIEPALAAHQLALRAALARHQAVCPAAKETLHLYRLDRNNEDKLLVRPYPLGAVPIPSEPITQMAVLRDRLLDLLGEPMSYKILWKTNSGGIQIEIPPCPAGVGPMTHRAKTFAWTYLESQSDRPVFPYCVA